MSETLSIERHGARRASDAFERCIAGGGVAAFPADTLYGLGCDPSSAAAIDRIHALKGRDEGRPSAVMFFAPLAMRELLVTLGPRTREAIGALLPGPVTLVVHNRERRYPLACREDPERLGIRLIDGPLAGLAAAAFQTSANRSGGPAPARFEDLDSDLVDGVDLAVDGGPLGGEPSTVIDVASVDEDGPWRILRQGAMAEADVCAALGDVPA